jgi:hypothetical protein
MHNLRAWAIRLLWGQVQELGLEQEQEQEQEQKQDRRLLQEEERLRRRVKRVQVDEQQQHHYRHRHQQTLQLHLHLHYQLLRQRQLPQVSTRRAAGPSLDPPYHALTSLDFHHLKKLSHIQRRQKLFYFLHF